MLSDEAAPRDFLAREAHAGALARVIMRCETPFVVGVYGEWGAGKTTLLEMTSQQVAETGVPIVWFNAWVHQNDDSPVAALIQALALNRKAGRWAKKALTVMAGTVSEMLLRTATGMQLKDVDDLASRYDRETFNLRDQRSLLREYLGNMLDEARGDASRIVIVIDDLDRCDPEASLKILEAMKQYLNQAGCVFVLAADRVELERAVRIRYGDHMPATRKYLEKIVQLPFQLPPIDYHAMDAFVSRHIPKELAGCSDLLVISLGRNPRAVKRFINALTLNYELAAGSFRRDVDVRLLCLVLLIQYLAADQYQLMCEAPDFLDSIIEKSGENAEPALRPALAAGPFNTAQAADYIHLSATTEIYVESPLEDEPRSRRGARSPNPSFMRPLKPSPSLAAIVGKKPMPRTEVTKKVWNYIKRNGLQDPSNRRMINPDAKLALVVGREPVSLFELTKHMNKHVSEEDGA